MVTTLAVYNSDGCVGRCDAHCHEARTPKCTCICGGRNHGKGLKQAVENNKQLIDDENLKRFAEAHDPPFDPKDLALVDRVEVKDSRQARRDAYMKINQMELFT